MKQWLVEKEKQYLARKLLDLDGNIGLTARNCRISLRTLTRKMQRYGLDKAVYKKKNLEPNLTGGFLRARSTPSLPKPPDA